MNRCIIRSVLLVSLLGSASGCENASPDSLPREPQRKSAEKQGARGPSLTLEHSVGEDGDVTLFYAPGAVGARVAEIMLRADGALKLEGYRPGAAAQSAGKDVYVQDKGDGLFRVVVLSGSNATPLGAGELASLSFDKGQDPTRVSLRILTDRPLLAPLDAQSGLTVGDPIEL